MRPDQEKWVETGGRKSFYSIYVMQSLVYKDSFHILDWQHGRIDWKITFVLLILFAEAPYTGRRTMKIIPACIVYSIHVCFLQGLYAVRLRE